MICKNFALGRDNVYVKTILKNLGKMLIAVITAVILFYFTAVGALVLVFNNQHGVLFAFLLQVVTFLIEFAIVGSLWGFIKKQFIYIPVCIVLFICLAVFCAFFGFQKYQDSIPTVGESDDLLVSYAPYAYDTKP